MISYTTVVWFFSFSSTSYVVPVVLYNAKNVIHSNMHVDFDMFILPSSENQTTKSRMETKNIHYFCFWIKWCWRVNSMKKTSSMSKGSSNVSKSRFGCYFRRRIVNFKNLIILFWYIWVIYGSWKSYRGGVFYSEHIKTTRNSGSRIS